MSSFDPFAEVRASGTSEQRLHRSADSSSSGSMTDGGWTQISYSNGYEERGGGGGGGGGSSAGVAAAAAAARYAAPPSSAVAASSSHSSSTASAAASASHMHMHGHRNSSQSPRIDSSVPIGPNGSSASSSSKGHKGTPHAVVGSTAAAIRQTFQKPAVPVSLNVYDLHPYNQYLHGLGFGAYHSAVQIFGKGRPTRRQNSNGCAADLWEGSD